MSNSQMPHTHPETTEAHLVEELFSIGTDWARYGLGVAQLLLQTSQRTLGKTAHALGEIADRLDTTHERKDDRRDVVDTSGH